MEFQGWQSVGRVVRLPTRTHTKTAASKRMRPFVVVQSGRPDSNRRRPASKLDVVYSWGFLDIPHSSVFIGETIPSCSDHIREIPPERLPGGYPIFRGNRCPLLWRTRMRDKITTRKVDALKPNPAKD